MCGKQIENISHIEVGRYRRTCRYVGINDVWNSIAEVVARSSLIKGSISELDRCLYTLLKLAIWV